LLSDAIESEYIFFETRVRVQVQVYRSSTKENVRKIRYSQSEHAKKNNNTTVLEISQHLPDDAMPTKQLVKIQLVTK